jgi:methylphosphotriester-DNA--protein-cysteine methyltransferase
VTRDVYHKVGCNWIKATPPSYKVFYHSQEEAVKAGKRPCRTCFAQVESF